jgi:hypothetical protein
MKVSRANFADFLAFSISIMWFVYIKVIGNLYISELLLISVFLLMFSRHGRTLLEPLPKRILLFGCLWLLSQVATDLILLTPVESLLKGWASIAFFLIEFAGLYMLLYGNIRRVKIFIVGFSAGGLLRCLFDPGYGYDVEPWKFGLGLPITLLLILIVVWCMEKKVLQPLWSEVTLLMLGTLSIYLNGRSLGGAIIITVLLFHFSRGYIFQKMFLMRMNPVKKIGLLSVGIAMLFTILTTYQWAGELRVLPDNAQNKYELTKTTSLGVFGVILAGRSELLSSIPAVIDSPIIGHGSWAEDPKYRAYLYEINNILGVERSIAQLEQSIESNDRIPAHSHLMQSWVWAGLLGAVFWIVVLKIIIDAVIISLQITRPLSMLIIFVCIKATWDLLFSPFSSEMRLLWAWELVLIIMAFDVAKKYSGAGQKKKATERDRA